MPVYCQCIRQPTPASVVRDPCIVVVVRRPPPCVTISAVQLRQQARPAALPPPVFARPCCLGCQSYPSRGVLAPPNGAQVFTGGRVRHPHRRSDRGSGWEALRVHRARIAGSRSPPRSPANLAAAYACGQELQASCRTPCWGSSRAASQAPGQLVTTRGRFPFGDLAANPLLGTSRVAHESRCARPRRDNIHVIRGRRQRGASGERECAQMFSHGRAYSRPVGATDSRSCNPAPAVLARALFMRNACSRMRKTRRPQLRRPRSRRECRP